MGISLNFNYKNVMWFLKCIENEQTDLALHVIGITEDILIEKGSEFPEKLGKYITSERFVGSDEALMEANIKFFQKHNMLDTEEKLEEFKKKWMEKHKKTFCHFGDFDLIHSLFIERFNIDLMRDDINYFMYEFKLNMLLQEETNALIERIKIRNFKPQKGKDMAEFNAHGTKMQRKYSL